MFFRRASAYFYSFCFIIIALIGMWKKGKERKGRRGGGNEEEEEEKKSISTNINYVSPLFTYQIILPRQVRASKCSVVSLIFCINNYRYSVRKSLINRSKCIMKHSYLLKKSPIMHIAATNEYSAINNARSKVAKCYAKRLDGRKRKREKKEEDL